MTSTTTLLEFFQPVFLLSNSDESAITNGALLLLVGFLVYGLIKATRRSIKVVHSHWHHLFDNRPFEPGEFYDSLKQALMEQGMEDVLFSTVTHAQGGLVSTRRDYLRVQFRQYMVDISAAPFAKEAFFVSWWLGDAGFTLRDYLSSIPVIGRLFSRREKTFYELDTEIMFKETVAGCVRNTIEGLTQTKGVRMPDIRDWNGTAITFNGK